MGLYVYRILCAAVFCAITVSLFPDGKIKSLLRLFSGIFLIIVLLQPGIKISLQDYREMGDKYFRQGREAAMEGDSDARKFRYRFIKENVEAYILDKAENLGYDLSVRVMLDEDGYPKRVFLAGNVSENDKEKLEQMLTEDLGISKEEQQWSVQEISVKSTAG